MNSLRAPLSTSPFTTHPSFEDITASQPHTLPAPQSSWSFAKDLLPQTEGCETERSVVSSATDFQLSHSSIHCWLADRDPPTSTPRTSLQTLFERGSPSPKGLKRKREELERPPSTEQLGVSVEQASSPKARRVTSTSLSLPPEHVFGLDAQAALINQRHHCRCCPQDQAVEYIEQSCGPLTHQALRRHQTSMAPQNGGQDVRSPLLYALLCSIAN